MSEAGDGTVELLAPVLCRFRSLTIELDQQPARWGTAQREASGFMVSPLGCLVQFTHARNSGWDW